MNHLKLYIQAIFGEVVIGFVLLADVEHWVRIVAGCVGVFVGIYTILKLRLDVRIRQQDANMRAIELKLKEKDLEDRIRKDYE